MTTSARRTLQLSAPSADDRSVDDVQQRRHPPTVRRNGEARERALGDLLRLPRRSPLYPELACALAAASELHILRSDLEPVPVRTTATTSQSGCYRMRKGDPVDLRVSRRHGRVALSFLHEIGHFVDHQLGWSLGPALREVAPAIPSRAPAGTSRARRRYFDSSREVWARSYAQTVLTRAADPWLQGHLAGLLEIDDVFVWPAADFERVAAGVERVLAELGLLLGADAVAA